MILILDFGGQYSQLIARRVREAHVYCELVPYDCDVEEIKRRSPKGLILSGGPASVYEEDAPRCDPRIFDLGIPILGICYGGQLIAQTFGGKVRKADAGECGKTRLRILKNEDLFKGLGESITCWMSHSDFIEKPPEGFEVMADTETCPVAAMRDEKGKIFAVQFHPEVEHTQRGREMIENFVYGVCGCEPNWDMGDFIERAVEEIRERVGDGKAICALSGGVDSSVAAVLAHKAIGHNLTCVFVDHGLLRKGEADQVERVFKETFDMNLVRVNAKERFLNRLKGVTDPEEKRRIIGEEFIRVFEEEREKLGKVDFLIQGTTYPDVIESGAGRAAVKVITTWVDFPKTWPSR